MKWIPSTILALLVVAGCAKPPPDPKTPEQAAELLGLASPVEVLDVALLLDGGTREGRMRDSLGRHLSFSSPGLFGPHVGQFIICATSNRAEVVLATADPREKAIILLLFDWLDKQVPRNRQPHLNDRGIEPDYFGLPGIDAKQFNTIQMVHYCFSGERLRYFGIDYRANKVLENTGTNAPDSQH
jgi:hypothetical protein